MSEIYLCSDYHLGHRNIGKYRNLSSTEENTEILKDRWQSTIGKRDTVFCLGDMCFTEEMLNEFSTWNGRKILILGNHDTERVSIKKIAAVYDGVHSLLRYKEFWLSHAPLHPSELRGRVNIHGHTHNEVIPDSHYINVCVEQTDMYPVHMDILRKYQLTRGG